MAARADEGLPKDWRTRVRKWASAKERIYEVYLFGSRAKGTHTAESDADLAYTLTGADHGEKLAYSIFECDDWQRELQELLGLDVDLQFTDNLDELRVWTWVREHGKLIYRKAEL